jgi:imidazolonepropionase-like amidohydrolase
MSCSPRSTRSRDVARPRLVRPALFTALAWLLVACGSTSKGTTHAPTPDAGRDAAKHVTPDAAKDAAADAPIASTLCKVTAGTSGTLLRGTLLLPAGPAKGEVLVSSAGLITCAATSCSSTSGYAAAALVDCAEGVISPALVNSHDHTNYATVAPEAHGDIRYDHRNDWRTGADGFTALPSVPSTTDDATIAAQELRFVVGGAASIIGSGGVAGLARNLAAYDTPTDETEGLTGPTVYFDTFPLGDTDGVVISSGCAYPSIEPASSAFEGGGRYAPHIAEGVNLGAENELTCASASTNDLVTSKTSVIHGVGMNANDVAKLQTAGAYLIWAPRSNISLYGDTAPITELRYANIPIALGTDWLPSGSMNMLRELACADALNQKYFAATFSDQDLFEMATIHGAAAAGFDSQIGSLEVGKLADITVFDGTTNQGYRAVIAASSEDVHLVMRGGSVLYGDAAVVSALAKSCTPWTVCGVERAVCIDTPGVTLSDIEGVGSSLYTITSCRGATPTGEPTCVPYRDNYPDGTSATDRDGDGVPDVSDDCPDIFDPVRPMDGTKQADVDGDGVGDACDAYPLDPTKH